jgi:hypothetical protein
MKILRKGKYQSSASRRLIKDPRARIEILKTRLEAFKISLEKIRAIDGFKSARVTSKIGKIVEMEREILSIEQLS